MTRPRPTSRRATALVRLALATGILVLAGGSLAVAQEPSAGATASQVVGPPRGRALAGQALEARTKDVAGLLRCPVCQGLSVADSPATMAVNMRDEVRELLRQGYDQEQILAYFEHSYGEFVRLEPPLRGVNWLVWLGPVLALGAGAWVVKWALASRRRSGTAGAGTEASAPLPGPGTLPDDPELARHVRRVRELAYGWPDGRPPESSS